VVRGSNASLVSAWTATLTTSFAIRRWSASTAPKLASPIIGNAQRCSANDIVGAAAQRQAPVTVFFHEIKDLSRLA
jgi:hypothetical protein